MHENEGADRIVGVPEVAAYCGVPEATIHAWRHKGVGPRCFRLGKHLKFRWSDVVAWIESQAAEDRSAHPRARRRSA